MEEIIHGGDIYRQQIHLDFSVNVNPFGPPGSVLAAMTKAVEECAAYPDLHAEELRNEISRSYGVRTENIVCGSGASELFMAIVHALKPSKVLIPVPSFYGYERAAMAAGAKIRFFEMKNDALELTEDILQELTDDVEMIFLANPNNPTGSHLDKDLFLKICQKCGQTGTVIVLDECFIEFTEEDSLMEETYGKVEADLIFVRSFTKIYAIPGVRLGFLFCEKEEICHKIKMQLPEWNLSCFAQRAGVAALREKEYNEKTTAYIKEERAYLIEELEKKGCKVWQSQTDFLLFYIDYSLYEELLKEHVLIRDCSNFRGLCKGYYRIAVKTHEENEKFIEMVGKKIEKH